MQEEQRRAARLYHASATSQFRQSFNLCASPESKVLVFIQNVAGPESTVRKIPTAPDEKLMPPVSECSRHAAVISRTCAGDQCLWSRP